MKEPPRHCSRYKAKVNINLTANYLREWFAVIYIMRVRKIFFVSI